MNALRFNRLATLVWACALVAGSAPSAFAGIVYTMYNAPELQNDWALSGTITVSRTGTDLTSADIESWAYTVTNGSDSHTYSSNDSGTYLNTNGLLATPTALILQYWQSGVRNYLQLNSHSGAANIVWVTGGGDDTPVYSAADYPDGLWSVYNPAFPSSTADGWVIGTVAAPVPEIDPAGIGSVLALVTGAFALLERRRLKTA
ncbi:MAG: hypothetical protein WCJ31_15610 [Planctomycetia bacterium]